VRSTYQALCGFAMSVSELDVRPALIASELRLARRQAR